MVTAENAAVEESPCSPREKALMFEGLTPVISLRMRVSRAESSTSSVPVEKHCARSRFSALRT